MPENCKIKIVHIVTRLDFGGAQFNTLYTADNLDKSIFEVHLLAGPGGTMDKDIPMSHGSGHHKGIDISVIPELRREISPFYDIRAVFAIAAKLRQIRPDIVHTHSSKAGILGRIAARIAGVPLIIHTFHGFGFHPYQNALIRKIYVSLEKFCARFSSALIFVSKSNMDYACSLKIGKKEKYHLIRSGIKLSAYPAKADRNIILPSFGINPESLPRPVIVFSIGNSKPQKNMGDFIRAAAEISKTRKNVFFVFAGGGEELPKFKKMAEGLGASENCILAGWRSDSAALLSICDIYAMTSLWEGLPRSLVEAFASGKPAVCYRADGIADILEDGINGFSSEKKDISGFIRLLEQVIDNAELRARLAEGAKKTPLNDFDIDYMVRQQETLYKELALKSSLVVNS